MLVLLFISLLKGMMQASVNSGREGITFLFLDKATNVRVKHGLAGFRSELWLLLQRS